MNQIEIDFEGGLVDTFPVFRDVVANSISSCGRQHKAVAADLDMSSSDLSRKINFNPNDNVEFPLNRLDELLESTQDFSPVLWLVERFLEDADTKQKRAVQDLLKVMPQITKLLEAAK